MNRRDFVQGAAALAAGAAVGLPIGSRKEAPACLKMLFFTDEPLKFKATIFSDEENDLFGIRMDDQFKVCARMSLGSIRKVLETTSRMSTVKMLISHPKERHEVLVDAVVREDKLMFTEHGKEEVAPIWIDLPQVRLVL